MLQLRRFVSELAAQSQAGDSVWSRLVFRTEAHVDAPAVVLRGWHSSRVRLGACTIESSESSGIDSS